LRFHLYGDCTRLQSGFLLLLLLLLEVFVITFCGCNFPILLHFLRFFLLHFVQKKGELGRESSCGRSAAGQFESA
jgi:hypothetical protein